MFVAASRVILDFYGNQDLSTKRKMLVDLCQDLRSEFGVSAEEVDDFNDCERCVLGLSFVASSREGADRRLKNLHNVIDQRSPARVVAEDGEIEKFA
jgi:uncharacterized protein YlxP (DUF503 family)